MFITVDRELRSIPEPPEGSVSLIRYDDIGFEGHVYIWLMQDGTKLQTFMW